MLLTFYATGKSVYINPDIIGFIAEEDFDNSETGEVITVTRIYPNQQFVFPKDVPPFIDVKESVKKISTMINRERNISRIKCVAVNELTQK